MPQFVDVGKRPPDAANSIPVSEGTRKKEHACRHVDEIYAHQSMTAVVGLSEA